MVRTNKKYYLSRKKNNKKSKKSKKSKKKCKTKNKKVFNRLYSGGAMQRISIKNNSVQITEKCKYRDNKTVPKINDIVESYEKPSNVGGETSGNTIGTVIDIIMHNGCKIKILIIDNDSKPPYNVIAPSSSYNLVKNEDKIRNIKEKFEKYTEKNNKLLLEKKLLSIKQDPSLALSTSKLSPLQVQAEALQVEEQQAKEPIIINTKNIELQDLKNPSLTKIQNITTNNTKKTKKNTYCYF